MSGFTLTPTNPTADTVRPPTGKFKFLLGDGTNGTTANILYRMDSTGALTMLIPAAAGVSAVSETDNTITDSGTAAHPSLAVAKTLNSTYLTDFVEAAQDAVLAAINNTDGSIVPVYNDAGNVETLTVGVLATDAQHGNRGGGGLHSLATLLAAGFMSAADKNTVTNLHFDVTNYGVAPGNTAAANVTAMNTLLQTTAPAGSVIYFPPGTYQFNAGLTTLTKDFVFRGVRGMSTIALTANLGGNFITLDNTGFYTSFYDLSFVNFVTQTAGYVIEAQNDVNVLIQDCFFTGSAGATLAGIIDFTGSNSGNGAVLRNIYIAAFTGVGVNVASPLDTMYVQDLEIVNNNGGTASVGIQFTNGGAALLIDCQVIACGTNISLAPTAGNTVSAVFAVNCFFDQGRTQSLLVTGAGTALRCHFVACWFTLIAGAAAGATAIVANTTGASVHGGLLFSGCHIINTPNTGNTANGLSISAVSDLTLIGSNVSGWATGCSVTPAGNGTTALSISSTNFGASGGVPTCTTGVVMGAGAYTSVSVQNNIFVGCTTPLTDASTASAANKVISGNLGLPNAPSPNPAAQVLPAATTYVTPALQVPANSLRVGTTFRFRILITTTASATTYTVLGKAGTAGTTADTTTVTLASTGTATSVASSEVEVVMTVRSVGAAGVIVASANFSATGTGYSGAVLSGAAVLATATVNTTVPNFIGVAITASAASTGTVQTVVPEVVAQ